MGWRDSNGQWHDGPDPTGAGVDTGAGNQFSDTSGLSPNASSPTRYGSGPELDGSNFVDGRQHGATIAYENFAWGGNRAGADQDVAALQQQNAAAQQRGAVQQDTRRADAELARAISARGNQQYLGGLYQQQLAGTGASAAQLGGQAALDQALQLQAMQGAQGGNASQLGAAQVGAGVAGQQNMLQANQQSAAARGQEVGAAAAGYGKNAQVMRGQDLASAGMSQEQAYHQAQLEAAQRARNDAMAQFYTGQSNDIRRQQLNANMEYDALRQAENTGAYKDYSRRMQAANDRATGAVVNYGNMLGSVATLGAARIKKDDQEGDNG